MKAGWLVAMTLAGGAAAGYSQAVPKPLGTVAASDATVIGSGDASVQLVNNRSVIAGTGTVTANPGKNADVALTRGGDVLVCQTTAVHLTAADRGATDNSLLLALDRGAMEIRMKAGKSDVVMTPDLRFTMADAGPLDLRMRVTFNGDTCVENRGSRAPALNISDAFGESAYLLKPGQHVMFEHGSLRTVMDRETTPCGCPPDEKPGMSLADAVLHGGQTTPVTPEQAAAIHPFPAAQSDGLAAPPPAAPETPGVRHVQVASTIAFDPSTGAGTQSASATPGATDTVAAVPAPAAPPKHGSAIGRFFKRIFGG